MQYMLVCPLMGGMVPLLLTVRTTASVCVLHPVVCVLLHPSWTCTGSRPANFLVPFLAAAHCSDPDSLFIFL